MTISDSTCNPPPTRLRLALQKSGRLHEESIRLLRACDLEFEPARARSTLKLKIPNFPVEFLFLRDDDIPSCVERGVADIGIVGENMLLETNAQVEVLERLGFGRCRLSIAVPRESRIQSLADLEGCEIATSYPRSTEKFLSQHGINARLCSINGSVEIAPSIGLAQAISDLVSSGSTLVTNGLRELEVVFQSEALLIAHKTRTRQAERILERLLLRVRAVGRARTRKYILLNAPNSAIAAISALLPGIRSPTVLPLAEPGWSSIHSVVEEDEFWERIEALKAAGAQGILVSAIEKLID